MAKIGLIDVDGHNYPNLPLMKLSAWHKAKGDEVVWYEAIGTGHCDKVYMSKIFSFSPDYEYYIDADEVIQGGSGYCIRLVDGQEVFDASKDIHLPDEIEHIFPDYSIYGITDTAYGFLSRGCPRGCDFCHVAAKEGRRSVKVADLNEFWNGQKNIVLCDPNILACSQWKDLLQQLIDSRAWIDFNQGLDIRLMTTEKAEMLKQIKIKRIHFAWDRYEDKEMIIPKFQMFKDITGIDYRKLGVFVLCNFNTTIAQDLERIYTLRDMGFSPYVMLYNKQSIPKGNEYRKLQQWCNNRYLFASIKKFEDFDDNKRKHERK
ncbi:radical SAM protein [Treponema sp.]|uniref:radical SAM protein n=1 Tax=Treponema sp. TaxID=166 RepID=UPI00388FF7EC